MNTVMSEKHFKKSSARLRKRFEAAGETLSHAQSLQELSNILFAKPYEEVKATVFEKTPNQQSDLNCVVVLQAGGENILMVNGEYVTGDYPGTDLNMGIKNLLQMAEGIANEKGTSIKHLPVPIEDIEDFETDDIIKRAEKMGFLTNEESLLKKLLLNNDLIFLANGIQEPYCMDSDWVEKVEEEGEDAVVWHMETERDFDKYEFFITFEEMCNAKKVEKNTWIINNKISHDESIPVELKIYQ